MLCCAGITPTRGKGRQRCWAATWVATAASAPESHDRHETCSWDGGGGGEGTTIWQAVPCHWAPRGSRGRWGAERQPAPWEAVPSFVRRRCTILQSPATHVRRLGPSHSQEVTHTELVEAATIRDAIFRSTKALPRKQEELIQEKEEQEEEEFIQNRTRARRDS
jgi:hypothetical protein